MVTLVNQQTDLNDAREITTLTYFKENHSV